MYGWEVIELDTSCWPLDSNVHLYIDSYLHTHVHTYTVHTHAYPPHMHTHTNKHNILSIYFISGSSTKILLLIMLLNTKIND